MPAQEAHPRGARAFLDGGDRGGFALTAARFRGQAPNEPRGFFPLTLDSRQRINIHTNPDQEKLSMADRAIICC